MDRVSASEAQTGSQRTRAVVIRKPFFSFLGGRALPYTDFMMYEPMKIKARYANTSTHASCDPAKRTDTHAHTDTHTQKAVNGNKQRGEKGTVSNRGVGHKVLALMDLLLSLVWWVWAALVSLFACLFSCLLVLH